MNAEKKSAHNTWIGDADIAYAKSVSPKGSYSEGIRMMVEYHRTHESNIDKIVDALDNCKRSDQSN